MIRQVTVALILLFVTMPHAVAEAPKNLNWENLIPATTPLENPLGHLSNNQQVEIEILSDIRRQHSMGLISDVDYRYEEGVELTHKLKSEGLDVDAMLAKYETLRQEIIRRNTELAEDLDGTLIRMPGYALPLEFNDTAVTEFLLVPYVGACIHVPAPPANQTVFVKLNQSYQANSLYEPIWITGRLKVKPTSKSLTFVDGSAPIEAGYTIEGVHIEPYKR